MGIFDVKIPAPVAQQTQTRDAAGKLRYDGVPDVMFQKLTDGWITDSDVGEAQALFDRMVAEHQENKQSSPAWGSSSKADSAALERRKASLQETGTRMDRAGALLQAVKQQLGAQSEVGVTRYLLNLIK